MTLEKIEAYSKYANGVYYRDYNLFFLQNETFEDFKQSFLTLALQFPDDPPSLLLKRYKFSKMCEKEKIPFKIRNMTTFSDLTKNINEDVSLIETLGGTYNPFECKANKHFVYLLSKDLYETYDKQQQFIDYMHGQSIGGQAQRLVRNKLFRRRFEIIKKLRLCGLISTNYFLYLYNIANEMDKPCPVKKILDMSSAAINWRKYYEKNKEKINLKKKDHKLSSP